MQIAITRPVSKILSQCELTHLPRVRIDVGRAISQHETYEKLLKSLGVEVRRAAAAPEMPDAVFVEDTAVVVDELAVITRPGAESRREETAGVEAVLHDYRPLARIEAPGTLDGGDVLRIGRTVYVGRSARSNDAGIGQLRRNLAPYGYQVEPVVVEGCLHLKSAATLAAEGLILVNPRWVPAEAFPGMERLEIDPREPMAANGLLIGKMLIYPEAFPRTRERLEKRGIKVATVDVSELAKAEGAVTCCCILIDLAEPV